LYKTGENYVPVQIGVFFCLCMGSNTILPFLSPLSFTTYDKEVMVALLASSRSVPEGKEKRNKESKHCYCLMSQLGYSQPTDKVIDSV
jgi:hypothetical protein